MSSWHYRVVRHPDGMLGLHEVYCDDDGQPHSYTQEPAGFIANDDEGLDGIILSLERALRDARARPILDAAAISSGRSA